MSTIIKVNWLLDPTMFSPFILHEGKLDYAIRVGVYSSVLCHRLLLIHSLQASYALFPSIALQYTTLCDLEESCIFIDKMERTTQNNLRPCSTSPSIAPVTVSEVRRRKPEKTPVFPPSPSFSSPSPSQPLSCPPSPVNSPLEPYKLKLAEIAPRV